MGISDIMRSKSVNKIEAFEPDPGAVKNNLAAFHTDNKNYFGAIISETGGLYAENIIRIFGSTYNSDLRDIFLWNKKFGGNEKIIMGDDIFGGIFSVDKTAGNVYYFAPDTLAWEDMNASLKGFVGFLMSGNFSEFYGQFSENELNNFKNLRIKFNEILMFYPPQWSREFKTSYDYSVSDIEKYYEALK